MLQLHNDKLQVELQVNAHYINGSPAALTELDSWWINSFFGAVVDRWSAATKRIPSVRYFYGTKVEEIPYHKEQLH